MNGARRGPLRCVAGAMGASVKAGRRARAGAWLLAAGLVLAGCGPGDAARAPAPWLASLASPDVVTRREAARAAGRRGGWEPPAVEALARALGDPDRWVREAAALALREQGPHAAPALEALRAALRDPDEYVRWRAVEALGRIGPAAAAAREELARHAADPDEVEVVRAASQRALERIGTAASPAGPGR